MESDIIIRSYREGDEEDIVELLESAFNGWPNFDLPCTQLEHWQWKYRDNPKGKIIVALAYDKKKVIGCYHTLSFDFKISQRIFSCFQGPDLAIHSHYRGQGVLGKLRKAREELINKTGKNIRISFTLNKDLAINYQKRHRWNGFPYKTEVFIRTKEIDSFLRNYSTRRALIMKIGFLLLNWFNRFRIKISQLNKKDKMKDFNIRRIMEFDERIEEFWAEIKDHYTFIVKRNREYLNWRYCDHRGGKYHIEIAEAKERILGYIILRKKEGNKNSLSANSVGYIVDLFVLPEHPEIIEALLAQAVRIFDEESTILVQSLVIIGHSNEKIFKRQGFLNSRIGVYINYKSEDIEISSKDLKSPERLNMQYGDTDWI
jgi:GNAT superfamily N-acetyltransferase